MHITSNIMSPKQFVTVGISLGSSHARVSVSSLVSSSPSSFSIGSSVVSNSLGSRCTPCLAAQDGEAATAFIVGEAAKKAITRSEASRENKGEVFSRHSVLRSSARSSSALDAFFAHLLDLAAETSGLGVKQSGRLRMILSVPSGSSPEDASSVQEAARRGLGKTSAVVAVMTEAAAVCCAHGLAGDCLGSGRAPPAWSRAVVVKWGATALSVTLVHRVGSTGVRVGETFRNSDCGGEAFVDAMMEHCARQFKRKSAGCDIWDSKKAIAKLREACEAAIRTLSRGASATVEVDGIMEGMDLSVAVSRPRWSMLIAGLLAKGKETLLEGLQKLQEAGGSADAVLLSGAVCDSPPVKDLVEQVFEGDAVYRGAGGIDPEEVVAVGCGVQCAMLVDSGAAEKKRKENGNDPSDPQSGSGSGNLLGLEESVIVTDDVSLGIAKLDAGGNIVGSVTAVITPGTMVGVEVAGWLESVEKGGEAAVVDMKDNTVIARMSQLDEGSVRVGMKLGREGGLVVTVGDAVLAM